MNNRERAEAIIKYTAHVLTLLAAQKFAEAVETLKTVGQIAEDIAKDLHE